MGRLVSLVLVELLRQSFGTLRLSLRANDCVSEPLSANVSSGFATQLLGKDRSLRDVSICEELPTVGNTYTPSATANTTYHRSSELPGRYGTISSISMIINKAGTAD